MLARSRSKDPIVAYRLPVTGPRGFLRNPGENVPATGKLLLPVDRGAPGYGDITKFRASFGVTLGDIGETFRKISEETAAGELLQRYVQRGSSNSRRLIRVLVISRSRDTRLSFLGMD